MKTKLLLALLLFCGMAKAQEIKWNTTHKLATYYMFKYAGQLNGKHYCFFSDGNTSKDQIIAFSEDLNSYKQFSNVSFPNFAFISKNKIKAIFIRKDSPKKNEYTSTVSVQTLNENGKTEEEMDIYSLKKVETSNMDFIRNSKGKGVIDFRTNCYLSKNNKYLGVHNNKEFKIFETEQFGLLKTYKLDNFKVTNSFNSNLEFHLLDNGNLITVQMEKLPVEVRLYELNTENHKSLDIKFSEEKTNFNLISKINDDGDFLYLSALNGKKNGNYESVLDVNEFLLAEGLMVYKIDINNFSIVDSKSVLINDEVKKIAGKSGGIEFLRIKEIYEDSIGYVILSDKKILGGTGEHNTSVGGELIIFKVFLNGKSIQKVIDKSQFRYDDAGFASIYNKGDLIIFYNDGKSSSTNFKLSKLNKDLDVKKFLEVDSFKLNKIYLNVQNKYKISDNKYLIFGGFSNKFGSAFLQF